MREIDGYPQRDILRFYVHFCVDSALFALYKRQRCPEDILRHGNTVFAEHETPCLRTKEEFKGLRPLKIPVDAGASQASELHSGNAMRGVNFGVQTNRMCRAVLCVCAVKGQARSCLFGCAEAGDCAALGGGVFVSVRSWFISRGVVECALFARGIEPLAFSVCL